MTIIIGILFGLVLIVCGTYLNNKYTKIKSSGRKTQGKIISYEEENDIDSDGYSQTLYYPIIEFTDKDKLITHKYNLGLSFKTHKVLPKRVSIIYLYNKPNNNYEVVLENDKLSEYISYILIVIGTVIISYILIFNVFDLDVASLF